MNIKSFIASQENGIHIAISGWGKNKNVFKTLHHLHLLHDLV